MEIEDLTGETLDGRFELRDLVGEGGYGAVFRGVQLSVERECAVKVLSPEIVADESTVERFRIEAKTTSRLNHPNTVVLYDFGRDEQHSVLYLAMELLEGESLREQVRREGPLAVGEAIRTADQVAGSLREAHEAGTVHRDVKPGNMMLVDRGGDERFVKVIDFGIAKAMQEDVDVRKSLTEQGMMIGTPAFMSPEQVRGEPIDGRTDQYALAMSLYFATTGAAPFEEGTPLEIAGRHLTDEPEPLSSYRPDLEISPELDEVLLRALSTEPDDRFETIAEFGRSLVEAHAPTRERNAPEPTEPVGASTTVESGDSAGGEGESTDGSVESDGADGSTLAVPASDWEAGTRSDAPQAPERAESTGEGATAGAGAAMTTLVAVTGVAVLLLAGVLTGLATLWVMGAGPFAAAGDGVRDAGDAGADTTRARAQATASDSGAPDVADAGDRGGGDAGAAPAEPPDGDRADLESGGREHRTGDREPKPSAREGAGSPKAGTSAGEEPGESGTVIVRMIPWGTLYVDGTRIGRGGRIETDLSPGRHELTMRQNGEPVDRQVVRVRAGARRRLELAAP